MHACLRCRLSELPLPLKAASPISRLPLRALIRSSVIRSEGRNNPPQEDNKQRAPESGDQILERDLQLPQPEVDIENFAQGSAYCSADHTDQQIRPAPQALLFESNSAPCERPCEPADNDPHNELANVHKLDGTELRGLWPGLIALIIPF